jgi:hypothetical protein
MGSLVEFCGEIRRDTEKAVLVYDGQNEIWLPRSMIKSMRQIGNNRADHVFEIPEWLAREKGIV